MPNNLFSRHGGGLTPTLLWTAAALVAAAVAALALGRLSDRVGRRPVAISSCAALVILALPASSLLPAAQTSAWFWPRSRSVLP